VAAQLEADVVIVGAGIAGALVGYKLAQAGVKVLILEAGPPVDRSASVQAFRDAVNKVPESAYPATPYAPSPTSADIHAYYVQAGPESFSSTYERRVGGTTWHWLGTALRHLPADFALHTRYGVGVDWPLDYDALEPWYFAAEQELGVSGDDNAQLGVVRRNPYPQPPIASTYSDKRVGAAVAGLGLQVENTPQARNSTLFDGRPPCCGNASCIPICPIGAKYDASVHVRKAQAAGAQLVDQAVADFVEVDAQGRVTRIRVKRPDRSEEWASGRVFVLAAHAIETPKLLLLSRTAALPNGVANSSDQVGRNLMDHPTQLSLALAQAPLYPYRSPQATSGIEQLRDGAFRAQRGAFRVELGNNGWTWLGLDAVGIAPRLIQQGLRGQALIAALNDQIARQFRLASLVEQLPDPENRVTLATQVDALGIPRPQLSYRVGDYAQAGLNVARGLHQQVFQALGASEIHHEAAFQGAGHIIGTYRMGTDPHTAVVDPDSRTHDHPNLFLLGSGVFPSTGTANPTLTIAALALRAVDPIRRTLTA
jgi:choline dehydrogenase-like flavoprotein